MKNQLIKCLFSFLLTLFSTQTYAQMTYDSQWKLVTDAESKGLPETALKAVNGIYDQAKKEKNAQQIVKAIIHQLKFTEYKEENAFVKNLVKLKQEADSAEMPVKPLLHSVLGNFYWQYYQNNRYKYGNRSETKDFKNDDIETWSLEKITQETVAQYQLSLQNKEELQKIKIEVFDAVTNKGNALGENYRPTLYDFLAHRAVDFYMNDESGITNPSYAFVVDKANYIADAQVFSALKLETKDELSYKFFALQILQDITKFHLNDTDLSAFVDVDLKRLSFVRNHLVLPNKEDLYLQSLKNLEQKTIKFPISTKVTYQIAAISIASANNYRRLQGDENRFDKKKAIAICNDAIARFPQSAGAQDCRSLKNGIEMKNINLKIEETNAPNQNFRVSVDFANISELHYRVIKITRQEVKQQREKNYRNYDVDKEVEFIKYFLAKTPLKTIKVVLPPDEGANKDYQMHSTEIALEGLPEGDYMILASNLSSFAFGQNTLAYAFTTFSNITYITRNLGNATTEVYALHRQTGEALVGVKINVYKNTYNDKKGNYEIKSGGSFATDTEGRAIIPTIKNETPNYRYNESFWLDFSLGKDFISTQSIDKNNYYGRRGALTQYLNSPAPIQTRTIFFLDRMIFRPGQTIYFKGIMFSSDGHKNNQILPNTATAVTFYDVNHQVIATQNLTTNEFGSFNGTFTAPTKGLLGNMTITNTSGSTSVSVEEYKRPKFEVKFEPTKGSFRLAENIKVEGVAKAYSGANIDNAAVKYRVVRVASFPYWWYCYRGYYPNSPSVEIINGTTKTDANGKFFVDFNAMPDLSVDKKSDPTFTYTVYADVTDINGETHSTQTSISVGYKALSVGVDIQDLDKAEDKIQEKKYTISTNNLAGQFEPAKGEIKVYQLKMPSRTYRSRVWERPDKPLFTKAEFEQKFPTDEYAEENNFLKWERDDVVFSLNFDTEKNKNFSLEKIKNWKQGKYLLEIISKDKYNQEVKEVVYFDVMDSKARQTTPENIQLIKPLQTSLEPNQKAQILIGTAANIRMLYEVELHGKIIDKQWLTLKKEQKIFEIPIKEEYRGGITVHTIFMLDSRAYAESFTLDVPYSNKELDIEFETFRNKLLPGQAEEWKLKIKGKNADKIVAEMVATLYDASLDVFRTNYFSFNVWGNNQARLGWDSDGVFGIENFTERAGDDWNSYIYGGETPYYRTLNMFSLDYYSMFYNGDRYRGESYDENAVTRSVSPKKAMKNGNKDKKKEEAIDAEMQDEKMAAPVMLAKADAKDGVVNEKQTTEQGKLETKKPDFGDVKIRKNFNETAFFFPTLQTNENGEIIVKFTIPEALTKWKFLGLAHTKDLKIGSKMEQTVTQKDLMVVPNQPRFFRENDKMMFSVKVTSLVEKELKGQAQLEFFDALTMKNIDDLMKNNSKQQDFNVKGGQSQNLEWSISIPEGAQAVLYRIVAKSGTFSDGEEMVIPVVTNRMLVTETMPLPIRGNQTKEFKFEKLLASKSSNTLKHNRFTLEFTSNPAWYAVQALPYLMEYPYECVEQTFSRYYANSIATNVANSNPKIKRVFDTWKNLQPDALLSNLEKNQELKSALLEETPWVLNAKDESQRKRNVGLLFDLNRMANEQEKALEKVQKHQTGNGGFTWFLGMPADRYMTQHIVAGFGHLDVLGVKSIRTDAKTLQMIQRAVQYLDNEIADDYARLKACVKKGNCKFSDNNLGYTQIHYLYVRSYFKDMPVSGSAKEAFDYYLGQQKTFWLARNEYMQGMIALSLHRFGEKVITKNIIKSLTERSLKSEEFGMYWKYERGWYWYQAPIETQALMIEVYDEVAGDLKAVEDLKVWLLKQKQTQDWKTTKATSEACFALLRRGADALASDQIVEITIGGEKIDPKTREDVKMEAGTGYFKTAWTADQVKPSFGNIKVEKKDAGVAWGAVYWQYFEQLDKITSAETPLKLKKQLFIEQDSDRGKVIVPIEGKDIKIGDLIKVRIELRVDRNMEYVHLKDMRASAFEPISTISTYKYQDGLGYYESMRDLSANFFIGYLNKGTYVFEYDLRASQKGDFSNGITTIQCMYAPEFSSHSEGIRVKIK